MYTYSACMLSTYRIYLYVIYLQKNFYHKTLVFYIHHKQQSLDCYKWIIPRNLYMQGSQKSRFSSFSSFCFDIVFIFHIIWSTTSFIISLLRILIENFHIFLFYFRNENIKKLLKQASCIYMCILHFAK